MKLALLIGQMQLLPQPDTKHSVPSANLASAFGRSMGWVRSVKLIGLANLKSAMSFTVWFAFGWTIISVTFIVVPPTLYFDDPKNTSKNPYVKFLQMEIVISLLLLLFSVFVFLNHYLDNSLIDWTPRTSSSPCMSIILPEFFKKIFFGVWIFLRLQSHQKPNKL